MAHRPESRPSASQPAAAQPVPPLPEAPQPGPGRQAFVLLPFAAAAGLAGIRIEGWLQRQRETLTLEFQLLCSSGGESPRGGNGIVWPAACNAPSRRDGLWHHTCLEWFVADRRQEAYWEFNLSPNGDWNVYALDGYRSGLRPDPGYSSLPLQASSGRSGRGFRVRAPLPAPLAAVPPLGLDLAVTAVVEQGSGDLSYWALHHGGPEADFHRRDGFRLRI